jgi:hypothetical protein
MASPHGEVGQAQIVDSADVASGCIEVLLPGESANQATAKKSGALSNGSREKNNNINSDNFPCCSSN